MKTGIIIFHWKPIEVFGGNSFRKATGADNNRYSLYAYFVRN